MVKDYITDVTFERVDDNQTIVHMLGYYEPIGFKNKIMNILFLRRVMKKRGEAVLTGYKDLIEK